MSFTTPMDIFRALPTADGDATNHSQWEPSQIFPPNHSVERECDGPAVMSVLLATSEKIAAQGLINQRVGDPAGEVIDKAWRGTSLTRSREAVTHGGQVERDLAHVVTGANDGDMQAVPVQGVMGSYRDGARSIQGELLDDLPDGGTGDVDRYNLEERSEGHRIFSNGSMTAFTP